jgi:SAM-dependent methyltransferase
MDLKQFFIETMAEDAGITEVTRIVDLGSGRSKNVVPLLEKFPNLTYIGVEPRKEDADAARELLKRFPNARVYNQLAYDPLPNEAPFDVCMSLSVLEHVKYLELFLKNSINLTASGGHIVHRYDLGHALHPSSLKERVQVFLGNRFPALLSEYKFVQYLDPDVVTDVMQKNGAPVDRITYHQMPNHKAFLKSFTPHDARGRDLAREICAWEFRISPYLSGIEKGTRESLFPTIALWARKS